MADLLNLELCGLLLWHVVQVRQIAEPQLQLFGLYHLLECFYVPKGYGTAFESS